MWSRALICEVVVHRGDLLHPPEPAFTLMNQFDIASQLPDETDPSRLPAPRRWGRVLAGGYLLLLAMAAGYVTYRLNFARIRSPFAGTIMLILGWPWARWLGELFRIHGGAGVALVLILSYTANALLLYLVGAGLQRITGRGR